MPRLVDMAIAAVARELRHEIRNGATWADSHMRHRGVTSAEVIVDSSAGFSRKRHPKKGKSPRPPTTIMVEVG